MLRELWSMEDGTSDSWFEDGPEVAAALGRTKRAEAGEKTMQNVLDRVIEPKREKWAEHFTWVALRLHDAPKTDDSWQSFAILAKALADDGPMIEIPLMRAIARRSIDAALA